MDQIVLDAGKIGSLPAMLDEVLAHAHERAVRRAEVAAGGTFPDAAARPLGEAPAGRAARRLRSCCLEPGPHQPRRTLSNTRSQANDFGEGFDLGIRGTGAVPV